MSLEIGGGFHALNINLGVVLVYSILVTEKSKRSKASTYAHIVLLGSKVPIKGNRILECHSNMAVR